MPIPDFQTLMLPVLRTTAAVEAAEGEVQISSVRERLADEFSLSQDERLQLKPSGLGTVFGNRVDWAKFNLGKAGLLETTKWGHFRLTDQGRKVLKSPPDRIDIKFLKQFPGFLRKEAVIEGEDDKDDETLTPDEIMRKAHRELETALADDLLQRVRAGKPEFFERTVVRLLFKMRYGSDTDLSKALKGGSHDGGVDGVINQDELGLDRVYVQAKRYAEGNSVGAGAIRDFSGSLVLFKANKGLFVTTSTFSPAARKTADGLDKRIVLIDGDQLALLMIRHEIGCRSKEEALHIKKIDEEFFEPN
jgi:restriction system protein